MGGGPDADEPRRWCASRPPASPATCWPEVDDAAAARRRGRPRRAPPLRRLRRRLRRGPRRARDPGGPRATSPLPTPVGVFAIRHLGCAAGIVVTASHNPPADNGLKLYMGDGAQIVPPVDGLVAGRDRRGGRPTACCWPATDARGAAIDAAGRRGDRRLPGRDPRAGAPRPPPRSGSPRPRCTAWAARCWPTCSPPRATRDVHPVAEQEEPDPDFPTVAFPNPEEPGVTDLLAARMRDRGADLGLALDPDADRVAVLVADWRRAHAPADRRRRGCPARRLAARRGDLGAGPAGGVERGLVVAAGAGRRAPRRPPRRDADGLQVALAPGDGAPRAVAGARLRGGDRLRDRPRRARQGRHLGRARGGLDGRGRDGRAGARCSTTSTTCTAATAPT